MTQEIKKINMKSILVLKQHTTTNSQAIKLIQKTKNIVVQEVQIKLCHYREKEK